MIFSKDRPLFMPTDHVAIRRHININMEGSEKKVKNTFILTGTVKINGNKDVMIKINTGSSAVVTLTKKPGSWDSSIFFGRKVDSGLQWTFFNVLANNGPAKIIAGIATMIPYNNVLPISALSCVTNAAGDGWGGKKPCVTDKAASIGIAT